MKILIILTIFLSGCAVKQKNIESNFDKKTRIIKECVESFLNFEVTVIVLFDCSNIIVEQSP